MKITVTTVSALVVTTVIEVAATTVKVVTVRTLTAVKVTGITVVLGIPSWRLMAILLVLNQLTSVCVPCGC